MPATAYPESNPVVLIDPDELAELCRMALSARSETTQITPELKEVLDYYDEIAARAPVDDTEWDFVITAAEYRQIREAIK